MKKLIFLLIPLFSLGQVGINTENPDASAAIDINAQKTIGFGGLKLPVVANAAERDSEISVSSNDTGLLIFNNDTKCIEIYDGETASWVSFDNCATPPSTFLLIEDFETDGNTLTGGTRYTTSVAEYLSGGDDFFTRINWPSTPSGLSSNQFIDSEEGDFYFGAVDLDSEDGISTQQTLTFTANINISSLTSVDLALLVGEDDAQDGNEDWDGGNDLFDVQFNIDGGGWTKVFSVRASSFTSNVQPAEDTNLDNQGDGTVITDSFQEFTKNIPVNGTTLQVRLLFQFESDDEDIGVDNIRLTGN